MSLICDFCNNEVAIYGFRYKGINKEKPWLYFCNNDYDTFVEKLSDDDLYETWRILNEDRKYKNEAV